ncbi:hypothetical protein GFL77_18190 [Rhizobium leguminosarum bv. viciae]|nr:hypothetical protein [Rhizobium leguminosarum bv. viciae]
MTDLAPTAHRPLRGHLARERDMRGLGAKVRDRPGAVVDHEYDVRLDLALIADVAHRRLLDAS